MIGMVITKVPNPRETLGDGNVIWGDVEGGAAKAAPVVRISRRGAEQNAARTRRFLISTGMDHHVAVFTEPVERLL